MPPKKVKPEPAVTIPEGDPTAGRAIFDSQCAACHALEGDNKTASAPTLGYS
jgi:cytochrome c